MNPLKKSFPQEIKQKHQGRHVQPCLIIARLSLGIVFWTGKCPFGIKILILLSERLYQI